MALEALDIRVEVEVLELAFPLLDRSLVEYGSKVHVQILRSFPVVDVSLRQASTLQVRLHLHLLMGSERRCVFTLSMLALWHYLQTITKRQALLPGKPIVPEHCVADAVKYQPLVVLGVRKSIASSGPFLKAAVNATCRWNVLLSAECH